MATEQDLLDHAMAVKFIERYISLCEKEIWEMETDRENGVEISEYLISRLKNIHIELCRALEFLPQPGFWAEEDSDLSRLRRLSRGG